MLSESIRLDRLARQQLLGVEPGRVKTAYRSADQLRLQVNARRGGTLFISQTYYPGWKATVNGFPTDLRPAASFLTALDVPAGKAEVVLKYSPPSVKIGG